MAKQLKPTNRRQLFEHLLGLWVQAEKYKIKDITSKVGKAEKKRALARKYREYLELWDELKW